ncbi:MAG: dephospho-CoA kinase, partial [Paludibacteraceae bacterium]|nr:dephospho-CoA kinase [Paludibacteraceae bacterium]
MIIGITGGIGSGKSTIARELVKRGFTVYDCDREAKRIIAENEEVQQKIIALLGEEAFTNPSAPSLKERAGGEVSPIYNTAYVAQRVFADETLLAKLNSIIHPAVGLDIMKRQPEFVESAILFESGLNLLCHRII